MLVIYFQSSTQNSLSYLQQTKLWIQKQSLCCSFTFHKICTRTFTEAA